MSKVSTTLMNFCVRLRSRGLGVKFPQGWLWGKIMAVASNSMAFFNANRMSTTVRLIPPLLKHFFEANGSID
jgi:hypothetical protein